ncbi:MAG: ROK family protein [Myxococcaceae bacterium]|nr:ROK family protein [Myxococcaceae bacterium]
MAVLGIDIGGTKIAAGLVTAQGEVLAREQIPTAVELGPQAALERLGGLVAELEARAGTKATACGVGAPGPLETRTGVVLEPPNLKTWWGFALRERLAARLGLAVTVENDANCAALAEARFGAGRGVGTLVYLTLSTGVGSGVVVDGALLTGERGFATELGHTTVDLNGRLCGCGLRGCLEALCSGTAIAAQLEEALANGERSSLAAPVTAAQVVDAVRAGDALAGRVWAGAMAALSAGIGNFITAFNPGRVVLGGGLTAAGALLFDAVRTQAPSRALPVLARGVEIVPAALGADVGVLGAAALCLPARQSTTR